MDDDLDIDWIKTFENEEKDENDRVIAPLEPYLESCIQVGQSFKYLKYRV